VLVKKNKKYRPNKSEVVRLFFWKMVDGLLLVRGYQVSQTKTFDYQRKC